MPRDMGRRTRADAPAPAGEDAHLKRIVVLHDLGRRGPVFRHSSRDAADGLAAARVEVEDVERVAVDTGHVALAPVCRQHLGVPRHVS